MKKLLGVLLMAGLVGCSKDSGTIYTHTHVERDTHKYEKARSQRPRPLRF